MRPRTSTSSTWSPAMAAAVGTGAAGAGADDVGVGVAWGTACCTGNEPGIVVSRTSGGGAGGAKWKGTEIRLAIGLSPRIAGTNVHWRTATIAASSRSGCPEDSVTSTFETWPSTSIVMVSLTSACSRPASAEGGYTASTWPTTTGGFTSPAGGA